MLQRIKLYQINSDRDALGLKFRPFREKTYPDPACYDKVFDAQIDADNLEDAFSLFNSADRHPLFYGHSMSVSDVIVTDEGAFYCDSIGFQKIDFDESRANSDGFIRVLFVCPHESPSLAEIPDTLEAKQQAVGGYIEYVYNSDETALIGDEEAKLNGKEGNRYLDGGGIIAGNFLVVGLGDEDCRSLTDDEVEKYLNKYFDAPNITPEETAADVGFTYISFM